MRSMERSSHNPAPPYARRIGRNDLNRRACLGGRSFVRSANDDQFRARLLRDRNRKYSLLAEPPRRQRQDLGDLLFQLSSRQTIQGRQHFDPYLPRNDRVCKSNESSHEPGDDALPRTISRLRQLHREHERQSFGRRQDAQRECIRNQTPALTGNCEDQEERRRLLAIADQVSLSRLPRGTSG